MVRTRETQTGYVHFRLISYGNLQPIRDFTATVVTISTRIKHSEQNFLPDTKPLSSCLSDLHPASLSVDQLLTDCDFERTRRGGPGGQHRNKVESAIVVTHRPSGVIGQAAERRSQHANRDVAIERLRVNLALAVRNPVEIENFTPSEVWRSRCRSGRVEVSVRHKDFAALLAEALDVLAACLHDHAAAAKLLGVSNSQLIKFLKLNPAGLESLNRNREKMGLGRLK